MSKSKYVPPHLRKKNNIDQGAITQTDARQKSVSSYFLENFDVNDKEPSRSSSAPIDFILQKNSFNSCSIEDMDVRELNSKIKNSKSLEETFCFVTLYSKSFNAINCSTCFHQIGQFIMNQEDTVLRAIRSHPSFQLLVKSFLMRINMATTWSIANALWCFGLAKLNDKNIIHEILKHAKRRLFQFNPQEICQLLRAIAKLEYKEPTLTPKILASVVECK
jgi:hypothetical protein